MRLKKMMTPAALVMALAFGTAGTASAQHHENRGHSDDNGRAQNAQRQQAQPQRQQQPQAQPQRQQQPQPQVQPQRQQQVQPQRGQPEQALPRTFTQAPRTFNQAPRNFNQAPRTFDQAPRTFNQAPRNFNQAPPAAVQPRQDNRSRGSDNRAFDNRRPENRSFDSRTFDNRRSDDRRFDNRGFDNRRFNAPIVRGRIYTPRFIYPRVYRPGFSLGFGLFFGSPLPYRYAYPAYGYGYRSVVPATAYGAISFALNPGDAAVYVDGDYVGIADTFNDPARPLTLTAGMHRIELDAPGYEPVAFDVNIIPGQLIPYQGSLEPAY